ncbi:MAG: glycoside hydrolase family 27 protein [Lachnospiraceae bacterium]|nr:glycoside hydrolase family 27 protein [Lachnospiraceae bacterium]
MKFDRAPLGWNSWDCYGAAVDEKTVRANAEFMAKNLKQYGWEYIVVDIQWSEPTAKNHEYHPFADLVMDEYGRLMPAVNRFPSAADGRGFATLAEYIHSLGLKFGIHIMRGIPRQAVTKNVPILGTNLTARQIAKTDSICHWNTDMYGVDPKKGGKAYYDSIFKLYAQWGVDFIKCDDICRELPHEEEELVALSEALKGCGRDMVLSLSPGAALPEKAELYKEVANMWRITDDFWDNWDQLYDMFGRCRTWCIHTSAGNYPDCDMLPIGPLRQDYNKDDWTKFSEDEQITMMTLWSIFRAPMMIGGEMTGFDDFTMRLLTNADLLDMQKYARHAHPVWQKEIDGVEHILWTAMDARGGQFIAVFNTGEADSDLTIDLADAEVGEVTCAKNIWSGESLSVNNCLSVKLKKHGAAAFRLN